MSTEALLRQAVRGALAVGAAGSMIGAGVALAQTAPAAGTAGGTTKLSNIVVTGSHIPQTAIATAQPIITINRSQIEATGFTTVGQLLQNMTQSGQALNEQFNNGGNGSEEINLHQLGSQRVLVLVNGQRWLPTLGNTVDLTTIPTAVVQRVEILLDGASAIYGSEAMAGVINVITTKNFNGARADAYVGAYDGHGDGGGWDGKTQQYSFTVGTSSDRSSVLLSAGYYQQQPVWAGQRNISRYPIVGFGAITGSSGTPGGRFLTLGSGPLGMPTFPGASSACVSFSSPTYDSFCDIAGPINGSNANAHAWSDADRFNYAPANYLRTPEQQWYTYAQGHYDLTDNVSFHFTTQYLRRNSDQVLAPNPWFFGLFGGLYANGLPVGISATNPYNPFNVDMVPAYLSSTSLVNSWCSLYGTGGGGTCTSSTQSLLLLGRRPLEAGNRIFNQNKSTFYFNGGFNGYFTLADNQWQWNVDYVYGDTLQTTITTGLANTLRIQEALGPIADCPLAGANPSTAACVPLNLFGGDINGQGTISKGMLDWVMFTAHDVTENIMRDYNANLSGNFWNSWYAGPWGAAVGYEYLEHDGFFSPDPTIASGNTVGNVGTKTGGRENTNAEYFEINIPLASGLPFAKMINLDLANRWSQFRWSGISNFIDNSTVPPSISTGPAVGMSHASTARATLTWRPIDQLLLRGTWSAGFRIPSISELFSGAGTNYPSLNDPCANPIAPLAPAALGCAGAAQPNTQILATAGGFANLQPEKSISRSVGFVYSPEWVPGLDINADYFKVEVDHIIGTLGGQFYLNACYYGGITQYCNNIVRSGGLYSHGAVTNIYNLVTNSGSFKVNGWDFGVKYRFPTTAIGDFTVALNGTFYKSAVGCSIPTRLNPVTFLPQSNCADGAGSLGTPKHLYNASLDWNYGPWAATWRMQIIGPMYEYCSDSSLYALMQRHFGTHYPPSGTTFWNGKKVPSWCQNQSASSPAYFGVNKGLNRLGTTVYNDVQASYTLSSWNTTFSLGANNLLNKQPPVSYTTFANSYLPNYYRTPGRFFYGRVSVSF